MNFKIPQNVAIDDKIFSFLTMKQLIILVVGGGIAYLIFIQMSKIGYLAPAWGPIVFTICILTIAVAFLRINFLPFHIWVILFIARLVIPQKRYWMNNYMGAFYMNLLTMGEVKEEKKTEATQSKNITFNDAITKLGVDTSSKEDSNKMIFELDEDTEKEINRLKNDK